MSKIGLFDILRKQTKYIEKPTICLDYSENDAVFKLYAIQVAISRIANSLAMAKFNTYKNKELFNGNNYWLFNYEPNINQNKAEFWQAVLSAMVFNKDGALIVQSENGHLIVAEDYDVSYYALRPNWYSNIILPGNLKFGGRDGNQVIHLTLNNNKVKEVVDGVFRDYGKLIGGTIRNYNRGNSMKVIVKIGAMFDQFKKQVDKEGNSQYDLIIDDIFKNRLKGMLSDEDSATPLEDGLELETIETTANTKSGAVTTRDITATFDDILNIVADAFHIPRGLMKGDVADVEAMTENYLNQCINPLAEQIETEFNRKLYGKEDVLKGTKLIIDTSTILTRDPVKFANAAEALVRIGVYNPNDVRRKLGEEEIMAPWADEYYVTKNYETVNAQGRSLEDSEEKKN